MSLQRVIVFLLLLLPASVMAVTFSNSLTITGASTSVVGALSKGSGTFMIDHPLDPKNKLLYHSFVESPDVKNIYDGVATLDGNGEVTIELPDYFLALNTDMRYLATPIDVSMPNLHVAREVHKRYWIGNPVFSLAGGAPHGTVSWQVTGIRHDPFIRANPIIPETFKDASTTLPKGTCILPSLCE